MFFSSRRMVALFGRGSDKGPSGATRWRSDGRQPDVEAVAVERLGDLSVDELGDTRSAHPPYDLADQPPVGERVVAVAGTRFVCGCRGSESLGHVVPVVQARSRVDQAAYAVQTRGVGEHVAHRDGRLAIGRELGPVGRHRFVVADLAPVSEDVQGGRCDALGGGEAHRDCVVVPLILIGALPAPEVHHWFPAVVHGYRCATRTPVELAFEDLCDEPVTLVRDTIHGHSLPSRTRGVVPRLESSSG